MRNAGIEFVEKRVPLFTKTTDNELEPYFWNYKVPVLLDDDFIVWDSLSIMEYLAEKLPDSKAWPEDIQARAFARSLSAEMHSSFSNLRNELPMNCRKIFPDFLISTKVQEDIGRVRAVWREFHKRCGNNGDWLCGDFGIVDAMYAPIALRFSGYQVPLDNFEKDYVQAMLEHPYIVNWIEASKQEGEIIEADEAWGSLGLRIK